MVRVVGAEKMKPKPHDKREGAISRATEVPRRSRAAVCRDRAWPVPGIRREDFFGFRPTV